MLLVGLFVLGLMVLWCQEWIGVSGSFNWVSYGIGELQFSFLLDEISSVCLFMLLCCGSIALFYCFHYFSGDVSGSLLFPLIVWFLGVMAFLVSSSSLVYSLVFWEYLGLVSFFLILFYSNSSSLRASLITLFASRFGDVSMFLLIMWLTSWWGVSSSVFIFLFLLIVLTKSACYPFVSWLLEAMRAPTPVSSLVHSSTLVAAGVWFVFRYGDMWGSCELWEVLSYFGLVTILLTSFSAVVFMDLKKIVALSTCNNVSWCLLFYISGDLGLALLQLLTHGVCKCYLFMSVGDLMSQSGSSQSSVGVYLSRYSGMFMVFIQGFLVFSLCGVPFLGVFFSKHGLFSSVLYVGGSGHVILYLFCLLMSYVYSVRLCLLLLSRSGGLSFGYSSFFLLICPLVFLGSGLNYVWSCCFSEVNLLGSFDSLLILCLQLIGCVVGFFLYSGLMGSGEWASLLWGNEGYVSLFYSSFVSISSLCILSFYRWEVYVLGLWLQLSRGLVAFRREWFTLNFLVLGLLFVFVLYFLLG